jgi:hypothetical protein
MFMSKAFVLAAVLALGSCAAAPVSSLHATTPGCAVSAEDQAWINRALEAWRFSAREITGIGEVHNFTAVFFDADCVLSSPDALNRADHPTWTATPHTGRVALPNGDSMPAGVTSFASAADGVAMLVMSTPSVWRAGGVDNAGVGLETMMVAVLLHEGSHVSQMTTYGARIGVLATANNLPEDFNDDSIQHRFESNAEFSASVARETDLLYQAVAAPDDATARRLAREARGLMRARMARYYTGADAYLASAEDVFLTMEGSGQYAGYQWVLNPRGAAQPVEVALPNFARRSRWWTQNEGLGLFLVLDRLAPRDWKRVVYGNGEHTILELFDAALAA